MSLKAMINPKENVKTKFPCIRLGKSSGEPYIFSAACTKGVSLQRLGANAMDISNTVNFVGTVTLTQD
tara:strand:- start:5159 stop:5362 length:204 start_codon:yes stop_codon:yes gene_type:complete